MNSKVGIDVAKESWCDVSLANISWGSEGRDLALTFHMHQNKTGKLTCTWAHSLNIGLVSGNNEGGYPLVFEATIKEDVSNGWQVTFNFASRGVVEFKCSEITLEF